MISINRRGSRLRLVALGRPPSLAERSCAKVLLRRGYKSIYESIIIRGNSQKARFLGVKTNFSLLTGERYDFVITADQPVGAYWIQLRGLGECGIKRAQQLGILRYARGPYQPATPAPTYDVGIPQGVVSPSWWLFPRGHVKICKLPHWRLL